MGPAIIIGVVIGVIVLIAFVMVGIYNGLVRARNRCGEAWSGIDVQLRRRASLIPNLVETVRGYAAHERETFEAVTKARAAVESAKTVQERAQAEDMVTQALRKLFAVAEAYPELRATENFQQLQAQLVDVEESIAVSRQVYNDTVLTYDTAIESVPTNIVAGIFNFGPRLYFETEEPARQPVQVQF